MCEKDEQRFQSINKCRICDKLFDVGYNKVRDHCHVTGKYRVLLIGLVILILFHNLRGYDSHLIKSK